MNDMAERSGDWFAQAGQDLEAVPEDERTGRHETLRFDCGHPG